MPRLCCPAPVRDHVCVCKAYTIACTYTFTSSLPHTHTHSLSPSHSRTIVSELGIYPAVDPLDSTSRMLDPRVIGDKHYETARKTQLILQNYKGLQVRTYIHVYIYVCVCE
jgi:hypothetical protein